MRALAALGFAYIALTAAAAIGWVMNIIAIIGSDFANINGLLVARVIGVIVAPLGAVLGYV
jgi:hypothetical protein